MGGTGRPERLPGAARRTLLALGVVAGALFARAHPVSGAATTPLPVVSAASGAAAGTARTATVEGVFDFPNALQSGTALHLVVFQGTHFVRYPLSGPPVAGDSALLADGSLDQGELAAFLAAGAPAAASVRFVTLTPDQARVALPANFTAGPATTVVFGFFGAESVLSNPLTFVLP